MGRDTVVSYTLLPTLVIGFAVAENALKVPASLRPEAATVWPVMFTRKVMAEVVGVTLQLFVQVPKQTVGIVEAEVGTV